jgi:hypothetical protein
VNEIERFDRAPDEGYGRVFPFVEEGEGEEEETTTTTTTSTTTTTTKPVNTTTTTTTTNGTSTKAGVDEAGKSKDTPFPAVLLVAGLLVAAYSRRRA